MGLEQAWEEGNLGESEAGSRGRQGAFLLLSLGHPLPAMPEVQCSNFVIVLTNEFYFKIK